MATKQANFRLTEETTARIQRLTAASKTRESQADIIAAALYAYERSQASPAQRALLDVYDAISKAIQPLQYVEEERDLLPEEQEVLDFLNHIWDNCRSMKLFTEPELPEENWEK